MYKYFEATFKFTLNYTMRVPLLPLVQVAQSVTTRAVNRGVVSSNPGSANFLSDV